MTTQEIIESKVECEDNLAQEIISCEIDSKLINAFNLHSDPQKCLQAILDISERLNLLEKERPDFGKNIHEMYQAILVEVRELGHALTWGTSGKAYEKSTDSIAILLRLVKYLLELDEKS